MVFLQRQFQALCLLWQSSSSQPPEGEGRGGGQGAEGRRGGRKEQMRESKRSSRRVKSGKEVAEYGKLKAKELEGKKQKGKN